MLFDWFSMLQTETKSRISFLIKRGEQAFYFENDNVAKFLDY